MVSRKLFTDPSLGLKLDSRWIDTDFLETIHRPLHSIGTLVQVRIERGNLVVEWELND